MRAITTGPLKVVASVIEIMCEEHQVVVLPHPRRVIRLLVLTPVAVPMVMRSPRARRSVASSLY
jgi:hypothetical protein